MAYHIAYPEWCQSESGYSSDKADNSEAFVPCGICEFQMLGILASSVQNLSYHTEDIHCRNHNTHCSNHCTDTVEDVRVLERTYEYSHFGNEAAQSGKTEVGKTGNDIAHGKERHNLHQTSELADIACVSPSVNHTDKSKEEGCHKSVAEHLKDGSCGTYLSHHQKGEKNQTAVTH